MGCNRTLCVCLALLLILAHLGSSDDPALRCLVCRKVVGEIETAIRKVDPKKKIQVGSYRIEPDGTQRKSEVQYAGSDVHMAELLESICDKMEDYVQATTKDTGERTLVKLVSDDNTMNPDISKVNITPDEDLNKMVKYYCENVIEDNEEHILKIFKTKSKDPEYEVCTQLAEVCQDMSDEEAAEPADKEEL